LNDLTATHEVQAPLNEQLRAQRQEQTMKYQSALKLLKNVEVGPGVPQPAVLATE
jgi:hypothetical protein